MDNEHPVTKIDRIRVVSPRGLAGDTTITDAASGAILRCVSDITLHLSRPGSLGRAIWEAELVLYPAEMDIEAKVIKAVSRCRNCRVEQVVVGDGSGVTINPKLAEQLSMAYQRYKKLFGVTAEMVTERQFAAMLELIPDKTVLL